MRRRRGFTGVLVLGVLLVSCSSGDNTAGNKTPMTESRRDSTIATSKLPGAGTVGKALEAADSARVRADRSLPESN